MTTTQASRVSSLIAQALLFLLAQATRVSSNPFSSLVGQPLFISLLFLETFVEEKVYENMSLSFAEKFYGKIMLVPCLSFERKSISFSLFGLRVQALVRVSKNIFELLFPIVGRKFYRGFGFIFFRFRTRIDLGLFYCLRLFEFMHYYLRR